MSTRKKAAPTHRSLCWSERAIRDLESIEDFLASRNPEAAARWIGQLLDAADHASHSPMTGRAVPEVGRVEVREVLVRTYRLVYAVSDAEVVVLTVFEGHQLFPAGATDDDGS